MALKRAYTGNAGSSWGLDHPRPGRRGAEPTALDGARGQPSGRALLDPAELCCLLRSDDEEALGLSWLPDTTWILSSIWKHRTLGARWLFFHPKTPGGTFLCADAPTGIPSAAKPPSPPVDFGPRLRCALLPATTPCSGIKAPLPPGSRGASVHDSRLSIPKIKARSQLLLLLSPPVLLASPFGS